MTGMEGLTDEEVERRMLDGQEVVLGGVEIHAKFVEVAGNAGICIEYRAPAGPDGLPEGIADINERLAGLCRNVMAMNDRARHRLLELAERDRGRDRMLYRFAVTSRIAGDGTRKSRVSDRIDPEFGRVDTRIAERARQVRRTIEQLMNRDDGAINEGVEPVSEEIFEIVPTTSSPLAINEQTEEKARLGLLEGEEYMLIEIQVIGSLEKYRGMESFTFEYIAAISEKAVSSPWMKEKIRLLSKVCENTVMVLNKLVTRRISHAFRDTGAREMCLYRLSVWMSMEDDGSPRFTIRDQIDPVFSREDSSVEMRAEEARRLAGAVLVGTERSGE